MPDGEPPGPPDADPDTDDRSAIDEEPPSTAGDDARRDGDDGLPEDVVEHAERLTRLAREAVDENERAAYRREREALMADHGEDGYAARVREDDTGATLVLYPREWLDDGVVDVEQIEDTGRAVERSLSGPGDGDDWAAVAEHNSAVADRVRADHGEVHGETAAAFAAFMSNHYAKPIERATPDERAEFREEYLPRNAWPSEAQLERLDRSMELILETAASL